MTYWCHVCHQEEHITLNISCKEAAQRRGIYCDQALQKPARNDTSSVIICGKCGTHYLKPKQDKDVFGTIRCNDMLCGVCQNKWCSFCEWGFDNCWHTLPPFSKICPFLQTLFRQNYFVLFMSFLIFPVVVLVASGMFLGPLFKWFGKPLVLIDR